MDLCRADDDCAVLRSSLTESGRRNSSQVRCVTLLSFRPFQVVFASFMPAGSTVHPLENSQKRKTSLSSETKKELVTWGRCVKVHQISSLRRVYSLCPKGFPGQIVWSGPVFFIPVMQCKEGLGLLRGSCGVTFARYIKESLCKLHH
jgi:hypothetical protein